MMTTHEPAQMDKQHAGSSRAYATGTR